MGRERVARPGWSRRVEYSSRQWKLLLKKREVALKILEALQDYGIIGWVYGSVARGDVTQQSDVDVIILEVIPSFTVEVALQKKFGDFYSRKIVQATPNSAVKGYVELNSNTCVSFPLTRLSGREYDFYRFGGLIDLDKLRGGSRVPGVDKRLVMIEPTSFGHREYSIIGKEVEVAKRLGVSIDVVEERERVLCRRNRIGRTGVFLELKLKSGEGFESRLKQEAERNPILRRRLLKNGW